MLGSNPKRPPEFGDGTSLKVQKIFSTIQGEGPNVGMPAIFIRLGGCNLACTFCDAEFESYSTINLKNIIKEVLDLNQNGVISLVVITGGEPLRQPIELLCKKLIGLKYKVQIETNGTIFRPIPNEVEVVCSPKVVNGKYLNIHPDLIKRVNAIKFLISSEISGYDSIPDIGQIKLKIPVYLQPIDHHNTQKNDASYKLTVDLALKFGHRVSYQIHKALMIE